MRVLLVCAAIASGCAQLGQWVDDDPPVKTEQAPAGASSQYVTHAVVVGGAYVPLMGDDAAKQLAFAISGTTVTAYGAECATSTCTPKWTYTLPANSEARGLADINDDGYPELMMITTSATSSTCGNGAAIVGRALTVISGADKATLYASNPIPDACISINGAATSPYLSMYVGAVAAGAGHVLAIAPQYYPNGWLATPGFAAHFYTAETASYADYTAARPMLQPSALGNVYAQYQQPFNGIVATVGGTPRYVAGTSGRFVQFAVAAYGPSQLLDDTPFLARSDLVGRTYGLLQQDGDDVFLINGTWSADLLDDIIAGDASNVVTGHDLHAGIERHVSRLEMSSGGVSQRFVSYTHDNNDGNTYVGRLSYPSRALLPSGGGPRVVYNEFDGATWSVHISAPGGTESATIIGNFYVWDTHRVDADTVELWLSPIDTARTVMVPAYLGPAGTVGSWKPATYFPKAETRIWRWKRGTDTAGEIATISGGVPELALVAPSQNPTTSLGYLRTGIVVHDGGADKIVMRRFDGTTFLAPITW